ncbi:MAG: gephyrin-like molybdotransferase Glp [Verrucomicrobiia bacterium]|jgi:molybdenum cofactor synthesis domain-containing protein
MITVEEARNFILKLARDYGIESVILEDSYGRIAARQINSPIDLPVFDNSSVDGYAVQTADIINTSTDNPVELKVVATVPAGEFFNGEIGPGECVQVFTGSRIPRGADAVVMVEATQKSDIKTDTVKILASVRPWENIRMRGEDILYGTPIIKAGEKITIGKLGVLSSVGIDKIPVWKRPTIAIISSGSELRKPGEKLNPGEIYECNLILLSRLIEKVCAAPVLKEFVSDTENDVEKTLSRAFDSTDVVITTGGISVGKYDLIKNVFEKIGGKIHFWKIIMKPGRPFVFGQIKNKFWFGLPGNPLSAVVTYTVLVRPFLMKSQKAAVIDLPTESGELAEDITNPGNRRHFMRVKIDDRKRVSLSGKQTSHGLSSILEANGLIDVPPRTTLKKGDLVSVIKWEVSG